jgi:hypothetical protein
MLASVDRQKALELLAIEHKAVQDLIDSLTDGEMTRPDTIRHGLYSGQECSFKDLLAHLTTYEVYSREAIICWQQGEKHWITDAMRDPSRGREIHFGGIEDRRHCSLTEMLDEWRREATGIESAIQALSDDQWRSTAPYPVTEATDLGGIMEAVLVAPPRPMYRHLPVHVPDADEYIRSLRKVQAQ